MRQQAFDNSSNLKNQTLFNLRVSPSNKIDLRSAGARIMDERVKHLGEFASIRITPWKIKRNSLKKEKEGKFSGFLVCVISRSPEKS
jgi:hypothetical protein